MSENDLAHPRLFQATSQTGEDGVHHAGSNEDVSLPRMRHGQQAQAGIVLCLFLLVTTDSNLLVEKFIQLGFY